MMSECVRGMQDCGMEVDFIMNGYMDEHRTYMGRNWIQSLRYGSVRLIPIIKITILFYITIYL